jgi:hypothetical protein
VDIRQSTYTFSVVFRIYRIRGRGAKVGIYQRFSIAYPEVGSKPPGQGLGNQIFKEGDRVHFFKVRKYGAVKELGITQAFVIGASTTDAGDQCYRLHHRKTPFTKDVLVNRRFRCKYIEDLERFKNRIEVCG